MQILAGIAILLLCICSGVVGVRLLGLWRRTRALPELSLGLLLLLVTAFGYPLMVATRAESTLGFGLAWTLFLLASACIDVGFLMLYVFTWRTFRPQARWCLLLLAVAAISYLVNVVTMSLHTWAAGTTNVDLATIPLWQLGSMFATDLAYAWTGVEAFLCYERLRRQRALGLADPTVCNRVLLWGVLSACVVAVLVTSNGATLRHVDVLTTPWVLVMTSVGGLVQIVLLMLIFLPPRAYLEWLRGRHAAAPPGVPAA